MRSTAAVLTRPKEPLEVIERDVPAPAPGEVTLRIEACGFGFGDWQVAMLDALPFTPLVLGQEAVGRVEAVGEGVALQVGARVGLSPLAWSCGSCGSCGSTCEKAKWHGFTRDGALTTRGNFVAQHLLPLPDGFDAAELAVVMGSGWAATAAVHALGARPGESVAVFGMGGVGHLAAQLLDKDCHVSVFDPDASRRALLPSAAGKTSGFSAALVCVPSIQALQQAFTALVPGGRLVVAAQSPSGRLDFPLQSLVGRGLTVVGAGLGATARRLEALAFYVSERFKPRVERRALSTAPQVLYALRDGGHVGRLVFTME